MNLRSTIAGRAAARRTRPAAAFLHPPVAGRRPALYLGVAAAGAILVNVLVGADPAAQAESATPESVSVAQQLGLTSQAGPVSVTRDLQSLEQLTASRSSRDAAQAAAVQAQADADQAERDRRAAEAEARRQAEAAAAEAQRQAEAAAAAQQAAPAPATALAAAPSGSFQDYALSKLGGDASQFSCLESLWGKESGWNPTAQNPSSTAYGIPQFLDSTWRGTGIAKTSDGYRQIDAGLIYIDSRYGSPCGAWAHSQSTGWY